MRRLLPLLPLVLLAAACGGGGKSSSNGTTLTPVAFVKSSAHKTAQAPSEHLTLQGTATVSGTTIELHGQGDFDNAKHLGSVHADFSAGGLSGALDEVLSGTTLYLKSPLFSAALPKGKTWLKLDLQTFGKSQGIDFSSLMSQNPGQALNQLAGAGNVTEVGDETIDGVSTTHYRAHVDFSKLPQGAKIEALTNAKYGPTDIWIGKDDGYVRRIHQTYSIHATGTGRQVVTTTMNFSNFGKAVNVSEPAASETVDGTKTAIQGLGK